MNIQTEAKIFLARVPIRKIVLLSILIGWTLLTTVIPVPAPPGGGGGGEGPN